MKMTLFEIIDKMQLEVLTGTEDGKEVTGGYCGDLLSWVMSRAQEGDVWFTVMGNVNAVAVAVLADVSCMVLCENAALDEDAREKALQKGICIARSSKSAYTLAGILNKYLEKNHE